MSGYKPSPEFVADMKRLAEAGRRFNTGLTQAIQEFSERFHAQMEIARARRAGADLTPEQRDVQSKYRYDCAVARERALGRAFVRSEASRPRPETSWLNREGL